MKKLIIAVVLLAILALPLSVYASGEETYAQASQLLAKGEIASAKAKFSQAASELVGIGKENAEFMAGFLGKMSASATKPKIIRGAAWHFIGEVKDENGVHHLYYNKESDSIFHSQVEGGATPEEIVSALGISLTKTRVTGDADGYKTEPKSAVAGTQTRTRIWACGSTTHIAYETFAEGEASELDSVFSKVRCGVSAGANVNYVVLAIVVISICAALVFLHFKTKLLRGVEKAITAQLAKLLKLRK